MGFVGLRSVEAVVSCRVEMGSFVLCLAVM